MRVRMLRGALVLVLGLTTMASACGGSAASKGGNQVTLRDFQIQLSATSVPAGRVDFTATNLGPSTHEFEVFSVPAGVDPNAIPVLNNVADTDTAGLEAIDEVEDIAPSTSASLTVALQPGTYALICNLPGHYEQGMHMAFTVKP